MNYTKIVAIFLIVLISSEIFYNHINNTPRLANYYLQLSEYNSSPFFTSFLQNAIKVRLKRNSKIYSEYRYEEDSHKLSLQQLELYRDDNRRYLESELPLLLYNLAITSFELGNENDYKELLEKSILLDPDLSFAYVELANYYYSKGEIEKGGNVLEKCISRTLPRVHCDNYRKDHEISKPYLSIGFLKSDINKYFEGLNK